MSQHDFDPKEAEKIVFKFKDEPTVDQSDQSSERAQQQADEAFEGTLDGRYKLGELIGTGGMAAVYRAQHIATGRQVAIKILSEAGDDERHARFKQEANAILAIRHPNIVG